MAFKRTRTINGKQYVYLEERFRVGKKVKSRSTYLGRALSDFAVTYTPSFDEKRELEVNERERTAEKERTASFEKAMGVDLAKSGGTPVEKASPPEQSPSQSGDTSSSAPDAPEE